MDLHLLLAALIVFAAYTVFGVTGFGASPITVPVLAHFLPLPFVLSLAAALDLGSAAALGVHTKKQADVRELLVLAPFTIIGLALGVFVCGYSLYIMVHRGPRRPLGASVGSAGGSTQRRARRTVRCRRSSLRHLHRRAHSRPYGATRNDLADGRPSTWGCASLHSPSRDSSPAATCGSRSGCFFRSRGRASGPGVGCRGAWRRRRSCVSSVRCSSSAACR